MTVINAKKIGCVRCASRTYSWARRGTDTLVVQTDPRAGQQRVWVFAAYIYYCDQMFVEFDLTSIKDNWTISLDGLVAQGTVYHGEDYTLEVRAYDWGGSVETGDFIPGDQLSGYTRLAYANVTGTGSSVTFTVEPAFEALIAAPDRPDTLRVVVCSKDQVDNDTPTSSDYFICERLSDWDLEYSLDSLEMVFDIEQEYELEQTQNAWSFDIEQDYEVRFRKWVNAPRLMPNEVKVYDASRTLLGILPTDVDTTEIRDGADRLQMTPPWRYMREDGTYDERAETIRDGWYLEYLGHWYVIDDDSEDVYKNQLPIAALSSEIELAGFYTNYGGVPFTVVGVPSEVFEALLGGIPRCYWHNGDFSTLDDAGFPVGWVPDDEDNWQTGNDANGTPYIEAHAFSEGSAELQSYAHNMVSGAEIKLRTEVWVESGFEGEVSLVLTWQNAAGLETGSVTEVPATLDGQWVTFESSEWLKVQNLHCTLTLRVAGNVSAHKVRFAEVSFLQNEAATGWEYQGSLDVRDPVVAYNDPLFQPYGSWTIDVLNEYRYSSTEGDVLGRIFTGDRVTVHFEDGESGSLADVLVDGVTRAADLMVESARTYEVSGLTKSRTHALEIVVKAAKKVAVSGLTLSTENIIVCTWNHARVYEAIYDILEQVGGEFLFDTSEQIIHHDDQQGNDLTAAGVLWLFEGENLGSFVRSETRGKIANTLYAFGYGDGAFQLGVKVSSTTVDSEGQTSQERFGVRRLIHTDKEVKDAAGLIAVAMQKVEENPLPGESYTSTLEDGDASRMAAGDTVEIHDRTLPEGVKKLRALQIERHSNGSPATVLWGDRPTMLDADAERERNRRQVEKLIRA